MLNQVGRTTAWTQGGVTHTCVDINVFGSNITLLCQTIVEHPDELVIGGPGDSGAGVFQIMDAGRIGHGWHMQRGVS